jgi:hypothetical protein
MWHQKYIKYKQKYLNLKNKNESAYVDKNQRDDVMTYGTDLITEKRDEVFYTIVKLAEIRKNDIITDIDKIDKNMILIISNEKTFDGFTNKFGFVHGEAIKIDWKNVSVSLKGIYLIPATELRFSRFDKAIYKNKEYESWWEDDWGIDDVLLFGDYPETFKILP